VRYNNSEIHLILPEQNIWRLLLYYYHYLIVKLLGLRNFLIFETYIRYILLLYTHMLYIFAYNLDKNNDMYVEIWCYYLNNALFENIYVRPILLSTFKILAHEVLNFKLKVRVFSKFSKFIRFYCNIFFIMYSSFIRFTA